LIDRQTGGVRQPGTIRQPAFGAGEFGNRIVETVGGHGEQSSLVWRGQFGLFGASADGGADAEVLPAGAGGKHDTEFEHALDLDLRTIRCPGTAAGLITVLEHAVDALDQPLEFGPIELIGTAETMHHAGFSSLGVGVPDALREGVVGDGRAVAVMALGDAQIHASPIARLAEFDNTKATGSCA